MSTYFERIAALDPTVSRKKAAEILNDIEIKLFNAFPWLLANAEVEDQDVAAECIYKLWVKCGERDHVN